MGGGRKRRLVKETEASPSPECGREVNFTIRLKEDEECPGRRESGWVADVSLCLLETHFESGVLEMQGSKEAAGGNTDKKKKKRTRPNSN